MLKPAFLWAGLLGSVAFWDGSRVVDEIKVNPVQYFAPGIDSNTSRIADSADAAFDTLVLGMFTTDPTHGLDTTVSPCDDFFLFVNGGWRNSVTLPDTQYSSRQMVTAFTYANKRMQRRLDTLLDTARLRYATMKDPTLKVLGTFYESCMVADSLEPNYLPRRESKLPVRDSTRAEQCRHRILRYLGAAAGQAFADELQRSGAVTRMENLLEALRTAVADRLTAHSLLSDDEKEYALNRLRKLILRVGIPKERIEYETLALSATDFHGNINAIAVFRNAQWAGSIGDQIRERWKASLLTPNAYYMPRDHAIEIPTLVFTPPFFYEHGDDLLNFAGVGYIIGHEIFHSLAAQLVLLENPKMKSEIEGFKAFNTGMGSLDSWKANGKNSFNEDIADLGGSRIAYQAWKSTLHANPNYSPDTIDGYTPDQRFYLTMGRVWRSKWSELGIRSSPHAPNFARVNAVAMQSPEFKTAFGCKDGDKMFVSNDGMSRIW